MLVSTVSSASDSEWHDARDELRADEAIPLSGVPEDAPLPAAADADVPPAASAAGAAAALANSGSHSQSHPPLTGSPSQHPRASPATFAPPPRKTSNKDRVPSHKGKGGISQPRRNN